MIQELKQKFFEWLPENNRMERIWLMAKFDFTSRYYGSYLGLFWALIKPLFELGVYFFVFTIIFKNKTENFLMFLFLGIILFQFFSESANNSLKIFLKKKHLLENIQINKLDIFYASILSVFWGFLFNFSVYFFVSLFFNITFSWQLFLFPIILCNLLLFILGTQLILATISIYIKDIDNIWFVIRSVLFWTSGIFFDISKLGGLVDYIKISNPMPGILTNSRNILIYGGNMDWSLFIHNILYAIILFFIAVWLFEKHSPMALEKL